ncbi:hypothetical protein K6054_002190 [Escherichia coli]|nr:hypothetical protein [Escherichia coli]EFB9198799.1 hypothetical protein [Escherichia coli]EFC6566205.1 hypothetical protein [Escherichia coli]EIA0231903.1 hypothetical protein [Escherichia coli]EJF3768606.1 hypothetical protein [Escherichia coli]
MSIGSEMNNDVGEKVSDLTKSKKCDIKLAAAPSDLLSKEGFALYIGKGRKGIIIRTKKQSPLKKALTFLKSRRVWK